MIAVIICFVIVAFAVIAYCGHCDLAAQEAWEREAFECRRADRNAAVIARDQEVARWCLIQEAAQIHFVGEIK
jgi:hypothetical protein